MTSLLFLPLLTLMSYRPPTVWQYFSGTQGAATLLRRVRYACSGMAMPRARAWALAMRMATRGSLTTFSIANDLAKYFAIVPALFVPLYPALEALNIMHLTSPLTAILSAIIYNALIIVALIPLALKGVKYREATSQSLLGRNLLVYGLGGIVLPFVAIKLLDMGLTALGVA